MDPLNRKTNDNDEELNPEILEKEMLQSDEKLSSNDPILQNEIGGDTNNNNDINVNNNNSNKDKDKFLPSATQPKDDKSMNNQSINIAKINTSLIYQMPTKYDNYDIQQMKYTIMKDYSQLRISKEEAFLERMKFDIYKRQIKDDRVNLLVEQNKVRLDEAERIQGFNRLIEDANRRIEAQENLELLKNKIDGDLISPSGKKYREEEWIEIYKERFLKYQGEIHTKMEEKAKEKREEERLKEEEEIKLCKRKKASQKVIDQSCKRLYEEAIKRKIRMKQKLSKINYEQFNSKYKKKTNDDYQFCSENEENNQKQRNISQKNMKNKKDDLFIQDIRYKMISQDKNKGKKNLVTEYNNKRFDGSLSQNTKIPITRYLNTNTNTNNKSQKQEKEIESYQNKINQRNFENDNEREGEEKINQIPKPQLNRNANGNNKRKEFNSHQEKQLVEVAKKKVNYSTLDNMLKYNEFQTREKDANKIVEHFFIKND